MNLVDFHKICDELLFLVKKAVAGTIESRGYWGIGSHRVFTDCLNFDESLANKYFIQALNANKISDDSTDWTVECKVTGRLEELFLKYHLPVKFEFDVECSEKDGFVYFANMNPVLHNAYFSGLMNTDYSEVFNEMTKLTLLHKLAG